ncbi:hypothetical protein ACFSKU_14340 [Pontibacter silvestris]|uniref:Tetratricopeptide repeat protein n=1 Tax=Pontibacter silvestris TaxID=2305183 RepID=A0ABW4X254_9BACT|nr:hypothetical protein [Pontibacter silvestris]MCC9138236.1 hypothetical protein [Pontibacter silvestris]
MNKSAFLKLIQQVSNISDQQTEELEKVAATFPYCQTAHLLLAKSAFDKGSMLSTQRLRRASSYATDRQFLKRIIYTSPTPEPVFVESATEEQTLVAAKAETLSVIQDQAAFNVEEGEVVESGLIYDIEDEVTVESLEDQHQTEQVPFFESVEEESSLSDNFNLPDLPAEEEPGTNDTYLDSELAMLLTVSSLSPSSTDLLAEKHKEGAEDKTAAFQVNISHHFIETDEALSALAIEEEKSYIHELIVAPPEELSAEYPSVLEPQDTNTDNNQEALVKADEPKDAATSLSLLSNDNEDIYEREETEYKPEDAEINYSLDEIDRLYAEDTLGYWMGSSRLGEVIQLKDEYTRPRPQSFHPELILEYSKTHELEKAVQPTANTLSKQLDIIDQFLKLNPRLKTMANVKLKPEPQEDLSLKSSKIKKGVASESLANIFINQGKVKKAIKIYEQLQLKYPEKKAYFAEQIEKLQNVN